jgi:microcin C transport system substrate-binding protein
VIRRTRAAVAAALAVAVAFTGAAARGAEEGEVAARHGIAMHGDLKYGPEFQHFDYVSPDAPVGGEMKLSATGTFDSLNPFIIKGVPATGVGLLFESLMTSSADEPFSEYGLLAESIEVPEDRSWVAFTLHPEARFHDGSPVTVEDVIFSFETLKEKGVPFYRAYYANVAEVEQVGERKVRFTFDGGTNRELPLILGQLPILSKAYYTEHEFDRTSLEPPVGSGPYRVKSVDPGRSITFERDPDYWGWDLPVNRGRHNFETIRYDYYRDPTVAVEAFKAGQYDLRVENISKVWATAYDIPAVRDGSIVKEEIENNLPRGMQGYVFNARRPLFEDPKVREALSYAFDFEWTNRNLFYDMYVRTQSYFANSEMASTGLPSEAELELLEPFRNQLPEEVFTKEYRAPTTDGTENGLRKNLRQALVLLREAGWIIKDGRLVNQETGRPFEFEILEDEPTWERITLPFIKNLERLGIKARLRIVDASQYQQRVQNFDFDMAVMVWGQSPSPGNEQRDFWSSAAADALGSSNLAGIKDPVIDALVERLIAAPTREDLVTAARALDRVLLWGHYVIPHWHSTKWNIVYWNKFGRPEAPPLYGLSIVDTWWEDQDKAIIVEEVQEEAGDGA